MTTDDLKRKAREEIINDIKAVEPRLWDSEYQKAVEGAIDSYIDKATLAERKRMAEMMNVAVEAETKRCAEIARKYAATRAKVVLEINGEKQGTITIDGEAIAEEILKV